MAKKATTERMEEKEKKESAKESIQENYMALQMLDQQVKQLQKYMQTFDQQLVEIRTLINSIKEFSALSKGDKIFAPMANGVFVQARLDDNSKLLINVGSGVVVNKSIPEAVNLLESQEHEILQYRSETLANLEELMKQAETLQDS